ncbi:MAG: thioredoxin-like domain-containing protein [Acidimicrobiia bacterium]
MRRSGPLPLFILGLVVVLTACSETDVSADTPDSVTTATASAPDTTMQSYAGTTPAPEFPAGLDWLNTDRPLALAQLRGKIVVLDFWTYGCINCIHVIPDLKRLEEEFAGELVVIGVHSAKFANEGDTDNIRQIILRYGLEHPVINDFNFEVWQTWGAQAWPTLAIIDPAGNVVGTHSGEGVYELFKPVLDSLVAEFGEQIDHSPLEIKLEKEGLPETALAFPGKVLVAGDGKRLFIADTNHHRIIVTDPDSGEVMEIIGSGRQGNEDGFLRTATFNQPQGLAVSDDGSKLYIADTENHLIRMVDFPTGQVSTVAGTGRKGTFPPTGGAARSTGLNSPWDVALDGDELYVAMAGYHQIWVVDLQAGTAEPYAGNARESTVNGPLADAELAQPSGVALDGSGRLYFADSESSSVRWADTDGSDRKVAILAGSDRDLFSFGDEDGLGTAARFQHPLGVAVDGGYVWVADTYNSKIKRIDPQTGEVTTLVGGKGWRNGSDPLFYEPGGIDAANGKLYVADTNNHSVRVIEQSTGDTKTLVITGLERYVIEADDGAFLGRTVTLERVDVAPGAGRLLLDVAVPSGYKVNPLAPSRFEWKIDGGVAELAPDAVGSIVNPSFPLEIPATFTSGNGSITGDLYIVYCESEQESICLIDQARVVVPVTVGSGGTTVAIPYAIEVPDL